VKIKGISLIFYYLPVFTRRKAAGATDRRAAELSAYAPRGIEETLERVEKDLGQEPNEHSVRRSLQLFGTTCRS